MNKPYRFLVGFAAVSVLCVPLASSAHSSTTTPSVRKSISNVVKSVLKPGVKPEIKKAPLKTMRNKFVAEHMATGTVSGINGTTITLASSNNKTYTVDVSKAKIMHGTLANILVGDKLDVFGQVNGTTVVARLVRDRSFEGRLFFSGAVTAVNGSTLTIKNKNNVTYTIDASRATVTKGVGAGKTVALSTVIVGDQVTVTGTLSGSTVNATSIRDLGKVQVHARKTGRGVGNWMKK